MAAVALPLAASLTIVLSGCSASDLVRVDRTTSDSVINQSTVNSYVGAVGMYAAAIGQMNNAFSQYSAASGVFTDELLSGNDVRLDSRNDTDEDYYVVQLYGALQRARTLSGYAAGALLHYGTVSAHPLVGEMYALQGYSELMLAEQYCSGVPLTRVPFGADLTYTRGLSTTEILQQAAAHFDTAYQYGKDSAAIAMVARVGKGRALLGLGQYAAAAAAVADVSTDARYTLSYQSSSSSFVYTQFWTQGNIVAVLANVVGRKGANGMTWLASSPGEQDPRIPFVTTDAEPREFAFPLQQAKYTAVPEQLLFVSLADGVEARLIEAEAQLQPATSPAGPWLATLNQLRASIQLPDTTDPGTAAARVDLLFHERAFWLYLTGHRQGDLRRLIRQYNRSVTQAYPSGTYVNSNLTNPYSIFGSSVTLSPPVSERQQNALYSGCIDRNA